MCNAVSSAEVIINSLHGAQIMSVNADKIKNIKEYIEEVSRNEVVRLRFRIQRVDRKTSAIRG